MSGNTCGPESLACGEIRGEKSGGGERRKEVCDEPAIRHICLVSNCSTTHVSVLSAKYVQDVTSACATDGSRRAYLLHPPVSEPAIPVAEACPMPAIASPARRIRQSILLSLPCDLSNCTCMKQGLASRRVGQVRARCSTSRATT